jgi:hypothetical protein
VDREIRVAGEILVDLHFVAKRDHRRQQLLKQNAAAAQLVDDGSEFELVWTATTRSMGYIIQSMCIACGTLLS